MTGSDPTPSGPWPSTRPLDSTKQTTCQKYSSCATAVAVLLIMMEVGLGLWGVATGVKRLRQEWPDFSPGVFVGSTTANPLKTECEVLQKFSDGLNRLQRIASFGDAGLVCPQDGVPWCSPQCCNTCIDVYTTCALECVDEPWQTLECCPSRDDLLKQDDTQVINAILNSVQLVLLLALVIAQVFVVLMKYRTVQARTQTLQARYSWKLA